MTSTPHSDPLFFANDMPVYPGDFTRALEALGIRKGDTILVHSDISVFGKLASYNRSYLFSSLTSVLKDAVTEEGTILMPTFSYSFCENKIFDPDKTRSKVGALTEYFRIQPDVSRTKHPIFSFAIWGKDMESYLSISKDSFDQESVFGILHKNHGKILFLGAPFQSCTFIHYIEQMHGVPYRFIKKFSGTIRSDGRDSQDECTFFVRYLDREVAVDLTRLEKDLLEKKILTKKTIGNRNIMTVNTDNLFNEGIRLLNSDINFFLRASNHNHH